MIWINFAVSLGVALVVLLITFWIGVRIGKHRVVDIAWGIGFAAVAVATFFLSSGHGDAGRRALVTSLTVVWGLRLAGHIAWRARGHDEDPRYEALLSRAKGNKNVYALRMVYLLQAAILWFVSLPVQLAQYDDARLAWWTVIPVAFWLVGMFFEAVGDLQLVRFKNDPANEGKVLKSGLWRYTRHPNYFGDACVWWGLYLLAVGTWAGAATIASPLLMTWLLAGKSGKPLMDAHMSRTRPEYADYIRRTSGFIPLPPKRMA